MSDKKLRNIVVCMIIVFFVGVYFFEWIKILFPYILFFIGVCVVLNIITNWFRSNKYFRSIKIVKVSFIIFVLVMMLGNLYPNLGTINTSVVNTAKSKTIDVTTKALMELGKGKKVNNDKKDK